MATKFEYDAVGPWIAKDPDAVLDYLLDFDATGDSWLDGDTISTAPFTVPTGLTKTSESKTISTATVWLAAGTAGATYTVTCHVTTAGGRQDDRSFRVICAER